MKLLNILFAFSVCLLLPYFSYAQSEVVENPQVQLSSTLMDQDGNPVEGAFIYGAEGSVRVMSMSDGSFTIQLDEPSTLVIEKENFETQKIEPEMGILPQQITLTRLPYQLSESDDVYIPFGLIKKRHIAGAVSVLEPDKILVHDGNQDFYNALNGRIPGLFGNNNIYGLGEALTVVDGVPRPADQINLQEISQVTVLKDVSSRLLYGAQADLPVILITTKTGQPLKRQFKIRLETGIMNPISYPEYLEASDYMSLYNEALINDNKVPKYDSLSIVKTRSGENPILYPDEQYYNSTYLRNNRSFYNLTAQASGGNEVAQYYALLGWNSRNSLISLGRGERNDLFNIRGNVDYKINDFLKMNFKGVAIFDVKKGLNGDFWGNSSTLLPNLYPVLIPVTDSILLNSASLVDGQYVLGGTSEYQTNIYGDLEKAGYLNSLGRYLQINTGLDIDLNSVVRGLTASANITFDINSYYETRLLNSYAVYEPDIVQDISGDSLVLIKHGLDVKQGSESVINPGFFRKIGLFGTLNYDRVFGDKHGVNAIAVAYTDQFKEDGVFIQRRNLHFGGQMNYNYRHKYLLQLSGTMAGSSAFAPENRYAFSPAAGMGWVLSEEDFFPSSIFLKLKANWGIVHSDGGFYDDYVYRTSFYRGSNYYYNNRVNYNQVAFFTTIGNPNLDWNKRMHASFGFESLVLDKTLSVEGMYFHTKQYDLITLLDDLYPDFTGPVPYDNYNSFMSKGVEFGLNYNKSLGDLEISVGSNLVYAVPEVIQIDEPDYEYDYRKMTGKPTDATFGWVAEGFFADQDDINNHPVQTFGDVQPGDIKYKDLNDDGVIDVNDQKLIGNSNPRFEYGLNLSLKYKIFEIFALGTGQMGENTIFNHPFYWVFGERKYSEVVTGRWTPETARTATYPRLSSVNNSNNFRNSTFWLEKNNWFTIHTVQLSVNMPYSLANRTFVKDFQIYLRGNNLFTLSDIKEKRELNIGTPPQFRTYSLGLNATF